MTLSEEVAEVHRTLIRELPQQIGERVLVEGWVHRRRRLATVSFVVVRDRTGLAQVVLDSRAPVLDTLSEETVVRVEADVVVSPRAPGGLELATPTLSPLGPPAATPPVELWRPRLEASLPVLLDHAAVTWRHPSRRAVWDLAAASIRGFRQNLDGAGFTEVQTPKLVGGATESGATTFGVDYFGRRAYLAQSPQFYKQLLVGVFERVYEVGPVFRAEPHDTVRHLAEYVSLDVELGFIHDHRDVLEVLRDALAAMVAAAEPVAAAGGADLPAVPEQIPIITFADALRRVGASPDEPDLAPAHERQLGTWARDEFASDFLAVEGYPTVKRPFYTHPAPDDPAHTNSFDLLFRGVELVTGGQRLHRYDDYVTALRARGEDPRHYIDYLAAFRHGMPPHGGFAIGLERWVSRLIGATNVRTATLFPRDLHRLSP